MNAPAERQAALWAQYGPGGDFDPDTSRSKPIAQQYRAVYNDRKRADQIVPGSGAGLPDNETINVLKRYVPEAANGV